MTRKRRGRFIALYGINNIGKSRQAGFLVQRLRRAGYTVHFVKYPVYSVEPTGPFLNRVLRSGKKQSISEDELQMWFTLNRYQFQPRLLRMLAKGHIVIAEDYVGTGIAWGTAKGAPQAWLEHMNKFLVRENVAILLDGKRKKRAAERIHLHETNQKLLRKCQLLLRKLGKKRGWKTIWILPKKEATAEVIWRYVRKQL